VVLECEATVHDDLDTVTELAVRYASAAAPPMVEAQAAKRIRIQVVEQRRTSWDHAKLAGAY